MFHLLVLKFKKKELEIYFCFYFFFKKSVLGSKFDNKSTEKHMEIREYPLKSNKKLSSYRATKRHVQKYCKFS